MTATGTLRSAQTSDLIGAEVKTSADHIAAELPEIVMPAGLPGFADVHRFALVRLDEQTPVFLLRGLDDEAAQFVVVPPGAFFPDYTFELDEGTAQDLGVRSSDDVLVLAVVTVREPPDAPTANLLAPVVLNHRTQVGYQVVLSTSSHSVREPLPIG